MTYCDPAWTRTPLPRGVAPTSGRVSPVAEPSRRPPWESAPRWFGPRPTPLCSNDVQPPGVAPASSPHPVSRPAPSPAGRCVQAEGPARLPVYSVPSPRTRSFFGDASTPGQRRGHAELPPGAICLLVPIRPARLPLGFSVPRHGGTRHVCVQAHRGRHALVSNLQGRLQVDMSGLPASCLSVLIGKGGAAGPPPGPWEAWVLWAVDGLPGRAPPCQVSLAHLPGLPPALLSGGQLRRHLCPSACDRTAALP